MNIIERVYSELEKQQIKPIRLAEHLKISTGQLSNWKARGTDPKAIYIKPIAEFLGISERYLLTGEEDDSVCDTKLQKEIEELDGVYLSLAKEAQKNEIDPRDIMMAIKMIKDIRKNEKK